MTEKDKKWAKGFAIFFIVLVIYSLGIISGKAYVIKYQKIHSTDTGYCAEIDFKEHEYEY